VAQSLGVKVIRFWASHQRFSTQESIQQIRAALDAIKRFKMQAVICLEDSLTGAGLYIPGDDAFHTGPLGHFVMSYWIQERYRLNYLPHIEKIVSAFKDDPSVLMWELGNEFALHPQPAPEVKAAVAFRQFAAVVSKRIKELSPTHLVGTGLVHHNHVHSPFENRRTAAHQLYSIPTLDAVSLHYYQHDAQYDEMAVDIEVAKSLGKPIYVGEVGMQIDTGDRSTYLDTQIKTKRKEGAFMVMPWNLDTSQWDANIGDIYAFSRRHSDFDAVLNTLKANAT
ncbi:MAG: cellulase family glycosylhydrolase, partial [Chloroflexota bacterium]|nr:cellulase family glycosylhydrolase [Chloroflexota bacterium]